MATRRPNEIPASIAASKRAAPSVPSQKARSKATHPATVSPADRHAMISEKAYLRAEQRGFAPGEEVADWLLAEEEVDALLQERGAAQ